MVERLVLCRGLTIKKRLIPGLSLRDFRLVTMDTKIMVAVLVLVLVAAVLIVAGILVESAHKRKNVGQTDLDTRDSSVGRSAGPGSVGSGAEDYSRLDSGDVAKAVGLNGAGQDGGGAEGSSDVVRPQTGSVSGVEGALDSPESSDSRITRLKSRLSKSSNPFGRVLFNILAKDKLSESDWEDVEDTLLLADVGGEASENLVEGLRSDARVVGTSEAKDVREALRSRLVEQVNSQSDRALNAEKPGASRPSVIIMVGVNGTGKTTTAGKLARLFVAEGKSVMLAAADTFRAAAADQLETWGSKVGIPVVRAQKDGADPASVAFEASKQAKEKDVDVLIIDTAGRLQNKSNLMDELGKIRRVTEKNLPVSEVLLVLDATTGQNGMTQAKVFADAIGITGVVLSKLDGSAKGGIVISVQNELGVPVKLVGLGEGPDDLAPFDAESFVDGILA